MQPIDAIRAAYPGPVKSTYDLEPHTYCVGGAVCAYYATVAGVVDVTGGFPATADLARVFQRLNPRLTYDRAYRYAASVTVNNDHHYFEDAWDAANDALTYGHEGATL